jgi:hypothetical protein
MDFINNKWYNNAMNTTEVFLHAEQPLDIGYFTEMNVSAVRMKSGMLREGQIGEDKAGLELQLIPDDLIHYDKEHAAVLAEAVLAGLYDDLRNPEWKNKSSKMVFEVARPVAGQVTETYWQFDDLNSTRWYVTELRATHPGSRKAPVRATVSLQPTVDYARLLDK